MAYEYADLDPIPERSSGQYSCVLKDETGAAITTARLTSLELTLVLRGTSTVINSRSKVSVLNTNGGALTDEGVFTWQFTPADTAIVSTSSPAVEDHIAAFSAKGDAGALERNWAVLMRINNIPQIPMVT